MNAEKQCGDDGATTGRRGKRARSRALLSRMAAEGVSLNAGQVRWTSRTEGAAIRCISRVHGHIIIGRCLMFARGSFALQGFAGVTSPVRGSKTYATLGAAPAWLGVLGPPVRMPANHDLTAAIIHHRLHPNLSLLCALVNTSPPVADPGICERCTHGQALRPRTRPTRPPRPSIARSRAACTGAAPPALAQ